MSAYLQGKLKYALIMTVLDFVIVVSVFIALCYKDNITLADFVIYIMLADLWMDHRSDKRLKGI